MSEANVLPTVPHFFLTIMTSFSDVRAALLTGMYPVSTGIWPGVFWPDSVGGLHVQNMVTLTYV